MSKKKKKKVEESTTTFQISGYLPGMIEPKKQPKKETPWYFKSMKDLKESVIHNLELRKINEATPEEENAKDQAFLDKIGGGDRRDAQLAKRYREFFKKALMKDPSTWDDKDKALVQKAIKLTSEEEVHKIQAELLQGEEGSLDQLASAMADVGKSHLRPSFGQIAKADPELAQKIRQAFADFMPGRKLTSGFREWSGLPKEIRTAVRRLTQSGKITPGVRPEKVRAKGLPKKAYKLKKKQQHKIDPSVAGKPPKEKGEEFFDIDAKLRQLDIKILQKYQQGKSIKQIHDELRDEVGADPDDFADSGEVASGRYIKSIISGEKGRDAVAPGVVRGVVGRLITAMLTQGEGELIDQLLDAVQKKYPDIDLRDAVQRHIDQEPLEPDELKAAKELVDRVLPHHSREGRRKIVDPNIERGTRTPLEKAAGEVFRKHMGAGGAALGGRISKIKDSGFKTTAGLRAFADLVGESAGRDFSKEETEQIAVALRRKNPELFAALKARVVDELHSMGKTKQAHKEKMASTERDIFSRRDREEGRPEASPLTKKTIGSQGEFDDDESLEDYKKKLKSKEPFMPPWKMQRVKDFMSSFEGDHEKIHKTPDIQPFKKRAVDDDDDEDFESDKEEDFERSDIEDLKGRMSDTESEFEDVMSDVEDAPSKLRDLVSKSQEKQSGHKKYLDKFFSTPEDQMEKIGKTQGAGKNRLVKALKKSGLKWAHLDSGLKKRALKAAGWSGEPKSGPGGVQVDPVRLPPEWDNWEKLWSQEDKRLLRDILQYAKSLGKQAPKDVRQAMAKDKMKLPPRPKGPRLDVPGYQGRYEIDPTKVRPTPKPKLRGESLNLITGTEEETKTEKDKGWQDSKLAKKKSFTASLESFFPELKKKKRKSK